MVRNNAGRSDGEYRERSGVSRRTVLASTAGAGVGALVGTVGSVSAGSCDYAIRPVIAPDVGYKKDRTVDAVDDLVTQINNKTNKSAKSLSLYQTDADPTDQDDECDWFGAVANDMESEGLIREDDMILAGHKVADFGYGGSCSYTTFQNNYNVYGGVHYIDQTEYRIATSFGIQELGHGTPWGLGHGDGDVDTDSSNTVTYVSPMATGYTYGKDGYCDTEQCSSIFCGSGNVPDTFCFSEENGSFDGFDCEVHSSNAISYCYEEAIDNHAGDFSNRC